MLPPGCTSLLGLGLGLLRLLALEDLAVDGGHLGGDVPHDRRDGFRLHVAFLALRDVLGRDTAF